MAINPKIDLAIEATLIAATTEWLEKIVIGLNLCPFAKAVHVKNQIRYVVSSANNSDVLLADLKKELCLLVAADPEQIETTLLIHPEMLTDFVEYNDFLSVCESAIEELELDGILQVASFHPQYQFADTKIDDVTNYTNRSPYPMLHLLREASVTRALESFPDAAGIYKKNIATLQKLGKVRVVAMSAAFTRETSTKKN